MKPSVKKNGTRPGEICPTPVLSHEKILMAHGGGGRLMHQLIDGVFRPAFDNPNLESRHDGAVLNLSSSKVVLTTDSYVVQPLIFPGGDIGSLAINGTVNDLAMCAARPRYLTAGFILEEGLPISVLERVVKSMQLAAQKADVHIVTGDTKVVARGNGDGVFINTSGVGEAHPSMRVHPDRIQEGDSILLSGDLARHGISVLAAREGLEFQSEIISDCAALSPIVQKMIEVGIEINCLRDCTRGGLATSLIEIAQDSKLKLEICESEITVQNPVRGACELMGFDPLYIANEGCFVLIAPPDEAEKALDILRQDDGYPHAGIIGIVAENGGSGVVLKTTVGSSRILDMLSGEQLPRIC